MGVVCVLATTALSGCAGSSCDELPELRAERDVARAEHLDLIESGTATPTEIGDGDDELHALERQVFDLEESCGAG